MKTRSIAAFMILLLPGCILAGGGGTERTDLNQAESRWSSLDWSDYDMRLSRSCFCVGAGEFDVIVRHDSIVAVIPANNNTASVQVRWWNELFPTVDGLIELVERAQREADLVEVEYDDHGWPTRISIDWIAQAVDDELSYTVTSVVRAPTSEVAEIGVGETIVLLGLSVRFDEIVSDSRCPLDVYCVWEGEATARLTVRRSNGQSVAVSLSEHPFLEGTSALTVIDGVRLRVVAVMPYPDHAETPIPADSYRIRVLAERV